MRRSFVVLAVLCIIACIGYAPCKRLWAARSFLTLLASPPHTSESAPPIEEELSLPGLQGPIRARLYRPRMGGRYPGVVVAHGIHYRGIDEGRLVPFARALTKTGHTVLTPELTDLADYRLTPSSVHTIASAVDYLAHRRDLVDGDRVGLVGFSFAGGLSLVAATDAAVAEQLGFVMSVGGHHDLNRVFRFLLTNRTETPQGIVETKAHDYGLAVLLYANLTEFLPEPELTPTRDAFRAFLHEDRHGAKALAGTLQGEGARIFHLLEAQRLPELAPALERIVRGQQPVLAALSPCGHLDRISVPVYLLHGAKDSVIPPSETDFAHLELGSHPHATLVTPLIEHVEVSHGTALRQELELLKFMAHLF